VLATIHRAENTDYTNRFTAIWDGLKAVSQDLPVLFPAHVRTRSRYQSLLSKDTGNIKVIEPVSYLEMIAMTRDAQCIITDSGGVQKEAFLLETPCVTVRDVTEWPETVESGANRLVGAEAETIYNAVKSMLQYVPRKIPNPFGDGKASYTIARFIHEHCL
jgi:UDP-N-acetylglucosamine 2-epimerase